jgi:hypothetical protein
MFGVILIFPLVLMAWRLAGIQAAAKERKWRAANWGLLTLSVLLLAAGDEIFIFGLVYVLIYGIRRGTQVVGRGQGKKRLALGGAIILFTLFGLSNYVMSLGHNPDPPERRAVSGLRHIAGAEETFRSSANSDQNKIPVGEYGTLDQLTQGGILDHLEQREYRFVLVVSGDPARDKKEFFAYASPVKYSYGEWVGWSFLPGGSWVAALHPTPPLTRHTFAIDESGVVRQADLGTSRPVTREETRNWKPFPP